MDLPNPRRDKFPVDVMIRDNKSNGRIATAPPPGGGGSSHLQEGSSSPLEVGRSLPPLVPICSGEELWFPRVINLCTPIPPMTLGNWNAHARISWPLLQLIFVVFFRVNN